MRGCCYFTTELGACKSSDREVGGDPFGSWSTSYARDICSTTAEQLRCLWRAMVPDASEEESIVLSLHSARCSGPIQRSRYTERFTITQIVLQVLRLNLNVQAVAERRSCRRMYTVHAVHNGLVS